jgi:hypothetical protein
MCSREHEVEVCVENGNFGGLCSLYKEGEVPEHEARLCMHNALERDRPDDALNLILLLQDWEMAAVMLTQWTDPDRLKTLLLAMHSAGIVQVAA